MNNSRNTIIGFLLIFAILIGYYFLTAPSKEELAEQRRRQDSVMALQRQKDSIALARQILADQQKASEPAQEAVADQITEPAKQLTGLVDRYGAFALASQGENKKYFLENDLVRIGLSSKGGRISYVELKNFKTWDGQPLILMDSDTNQFGFTFFSGNRTINTGNFYFQPEWIDGRRQTGDTLKVSGSEEARFALRLYTSSDSIINKDQYIEYLFTLKGDNYMLGFDVNFRNLSQTVDAARGYIDFEWSSDLRQQEKHTDQFNGATIYYKLKDDKVEYLSETKDDNESLKDQIQWVSFKEQFFSSVLIADEHFADPVMQVSTLESHPSERYLRSLAYKIGVPYKGSPDESIGMSMYFGPNKYNILRKYKLDLERQIPLGWSFFLMQWINRYAVLPVFNFLGSFGWNYGIVILILTILLKIVLYPVAYKTYLSSAKMRLLKPEVDEINAKYPKKEDAMKKQQAVMAMYKKAGVNPMSGCIPVLLQMPILIAMFRFFPASIELRQQAFLWANDLSTYDSIFNLPFNIPFYGDHVSLFTLLMTISTIIYTYLNNQMMGSTSQQLPGMKTMMYLMPIMFLGIFNNYSSGLSYYYLLVNLITFAQMYIFRYFVDEDKLHKKIQENKLKPVKVSGFQKRLEDMAKQRGYNPNTRKK
ncbi:MAG: membrane protein insertase YidC [Bacteroidales bacterium]|jgi:YidC/Oxa1 family membrane protein insertase|nr:membrane protein insertase YidC [Bacteroidales bacterium]